MTGAVRAVDVLVALATARFDRPLSYLVPDGVELRVGDVVRVPLGTRDVFAFVVTPERTLAEAPAGWRHIVERPAVPRAFDEEGLALAQWMADTLVCSLRDALGPVILADALPRVIERIVPAARPAAGRFPSVPQRFIDLLWETFPDGVPIATLVRHPEARRAGDRRTLLASLGTLVRAGAVTRTRTYHGPQRRARTIRTIGLGAAIESASGTRLRALIAHLQSLGPQRRADVVLAGYSDAVIRRGLATAALVQSDEPFDRARPTRTVLPPFEPTAEQTAAIAALKAALERRSYAQVLLHGITGSGKTLVYLHAIAHALASGRRAIVLVPEIALTPQTAQRFEAVFGERIAVMHSALSERERYDAWHAAAAGALDVIVGARSAVFAPLRDVGIIVVDEAHEPSYRQESSPRYHAADVARARMERSGGVVVLGSATPLLDDYARARAGRFALLRLRERATAQPLPATRIIDMTAAFAAGGRHALSTQLVVALDERLRRGEKSVLFLNRRGAARFVLCRACGFVPPCERCSTALVVHRTEGLLRCHYCDAQRPLPTSCPSCGGGPIAPLGLGTERVATDLAELFPAARIVRMDADTTTQLGDHARLLDRFAREGDVLIGTQMVAKGLDFPEVTLVGALAADLDLHLPDYRAAERTFDTIVQVCGRSGRARPGEALVQTYAPDHPAIRLAAEHDFEGFAAGELAERRALSWPPYTRLVFLGAIGREKGAVEAAIDRYAARLRDDPRWTILGPAPYPLARLNDEWRYRLAIKTKQLPPLRDALRSHIVPLAAKDRATRLVISFEA